MDERKKDGREAASGIPLDETNQNSRPFPGGYLNRGRVTRSGQRVIRRQDHRWPLAVSECLTEMAGRGYRSCPVVIDHPDPCTAIMSYMPGSALTDPVADWASDIAILQRTTDFLRNFSAKSADIRSIIRNDDWLVAPPEEGEAFVHGDPHPTNIVFDQNRNPTGIIDFELATVGPHDWNLASLLYTWVPLEHPSLTCWRNVVGLSRTERFAAVLRRWPPIGSPVDFVRTTKEFVEWRKGLFVVLADAGNAAALEFSTGSTFHVRHADAIGFMTDNLHLALD
jgi:hypothetical protein